MKRSEEIDKIVPAFIKAQSEMKSVKKEADNPFFGSKYADLAPIIEATVPALNLNNIALIQALDMTEGGDPVLETTLLHESTQWIGCTIPVYVRDRNNPQSLGSAITYAKRYALQAMVGLATHDDDDGNAGANKNQKNKQGKQNQSGYSNQQNGNHNQNPNNNPNNNRKQNQSREGGEDSTQEKFQEAKDQLLAKVEKLRETSESTMKDIEFLEKTGREILKKSRPVSIEDVRKLWAAIMVDKVFDLATGERIP